MGRKRGRGGGREAGKERAGEEERASVSSVHYNKLY